MQLQSGGVVILLPTAAPGQSHGGEPGKSFHLKNIYFSLFFMNSPC